MSAELSTMTPSFLILGAEQPLTPSTLPILATNSRTLKHETTEHYNAPFPQSDSDSDVIQNGYHCIFLGLFPQSKSNSNVTKKWVQNPFLSDITIANHSVETGQNAE